MAELAGLVAVLVVDDEEPIRNALKKFLTQQQFEVYAAASGDEALNQLRRHKIGLMLCDIRMPGTSGVDLVPQALAIEPDLAILMLTAVNDATSAALCMQRGAMDYLTKPIELSDLGRAVQRALKRREMLLENRELNSWLKEEVTTRTAELHRERQKLGGARGHFFFQPAVQLAPFKLRLAPLERALDRPAEVGELDGLDEVVHGAALHAQGGARRVVHGSQHEDREVAIDFEGLGHEVDARSPRHADVAQHQGDPVAAQLVQGFLSGRGSVHLELLLGQEFLEGVADRLLVVDHQHRDGAVEFRHRGSFA